MEKIFFDNVKEQFCSISLDTISSWIWCWFLIGCISALKEQKSEFNRSADESKGEDEEYRNVEENENRDARAGGRKEYALFWDETVLK